jgi:hypothetical protein
MRLAAWSLATLFTIVLAPACSGKYTTIPEPGDEQSKVFDCSDYLACDAENRCDDGGECLAISGCASAICVSASVVCDQACNSTQCGVAASYPGQIPKCPDGTPIKGKGEGVTFPTMVGTGGGPSYAGSSTATGGYATAGYGAGGSATAGYASGGYATGGSGSAAAVNCQAYSRCNAKVSCAGVGFDCVAVPGCQLGICAPAFTLCDNFCAGTCAVLESYPVQLQCSSNVIVGYEGFGGVGGTSQGGSPQGYAGEDFGGYGGADGGFAGDFAGGAGGSP